MLSPASSRTARRNKRHPEPSSPPWGSEQHHYGRPYSVCPLQPWVCLCGGQPGQEYPKHSGKIHQDWKAIDVRLAVTGKPVDVFNYCLLCMSVLLHACSISLL